MSRSSAWCHSKGLVEEIRNPKGYTSIGDDTHWFPNPNKKESLLI
jgi:hypothetical protein